MASHTRPGAADATGTAPGFQVLSVQRAYYLPSEQRRAEHIRILYAAGEHAGEVRASMSWEALAQVRGELLRNGRRVDDDEVLGEVLLPWALEQLTQSQLDGRAIEDELRLDFGDAPRPRAVPELLRRYELI
jgi:hypothetical protein